MAYFYFVKDTEKTESNLRAIVENSEDQIYYDDSGNVDIYEVSIEDFKKIQLQTHTISSYDGSNFVFEQPSNDLTTEQRETVELVQNNLNNLSNNINIWLEDNNGHAKYSEWSNYKNYIDNVDVASILPLNKSWEKYCSDNSITFKNLLELPHK